MYPSNEDYSGQFHSPEEFDTDDEKKTMTALEIGITVGTVIAFALVLYFIFYCRHIESRRRAQRVQQQLERGQEQRSEVKESERVTTTHTEETSQKDAMRRIWAKVTTMRKG